MVSVQSEPISGVVPPDVEKLVMQVSFHFSILSRPINGKLFGVFFQLEALCESSRNRDGVANSEPDCNLVVRDQSILSIHHYDSPHHCSAWIKRSIGIAIAILGRAR